MGDFCIKVSAYRKEISWTQGDCVTVCCMTRLCFVRTQFSSPININLFVEDFTCEIRIENNMYLIFQYMYRVFLLLFCEITQQKHNYN